LASGAVEPTLSTRTPISYLNFTPSVKYSANTNVKYNINLSNGYSVVILINPGNSAVTDTPYPFYTISGQECFNRKTSSSNVYIDPRFYAYNIKNLGCIIPVNKWSLVSFTVDGSNSRGSVFLNNNTTPTGTSIGTSIPNTSMVYNTPNINSNGYNSFKLAALAFYNKTLTTDQIRTIYNSISGIIGTDC
jgi:hypothetical protein